MSSRPKQSESAADELFNSFLNQNSLKHTVQRVKIVKRAFSMPKHFSADDLYLVLRREKTGISKATVYRTLKLLVEAHFLDELEIGARNAKFYEPVHGRDHHDHMICLRCQKIIEFRDSQIEERQLLVARKMKFKILSHAHKIFGLCSNCSKKG